jgi:hypothetical protein
VEFNVQVSHGFYRLALVLALLASGAQFTSVSAQQVFTEQGVSIEFSVAPKPVAGEETTMRLKITDTNGAPLTS